MGKKYPLHPDFKTFDIINLGNMQFTPRKLKIINALGGLSLKFHRLDKNLKKHSQTIEGFDSNHISVTIYEPKSLGNNAPCLLYLHGGGFILRDFIFIHNTVCKYAAQVPCKVIFVHYRLAPTFPFPIPVEDSYASLMWVAKNAQELGINPQKIAIAGDSAGGALAAAVTQMARDKHGPTICFQLLIYPVTDISQSTQSMKEYIDTPGWNARLNQQMWKLYLKDGDKGMLSYASPLAATSFSNLPPAYIETEEFDCLRDEGILYADKLKKNGISVILNEIKGSFHGFDQNHNRKIVQEAMHARIISLQNHLN
jgi:acetyl esterase/lipase